MFEFNGNVLTLTSGTEIDMDTNAAFAVYVEAQVSAGINPSEVLADNTAIQWSSLPGAQTGLSAYNASAAARTGGSVSFAGVNYATNFSTNNVLLDNYAAVSGTIVSVVPGPSFSKALVSTSVTNPGNGTTNVAIGEVADYTLTLTVPQGVMTNVTILDTLPSNLAFVDVKNVALSSGLNWSQPISMGTSSANLTVGNNGTTISFNPGNVTNANVNDLTATVAITFEAVVLDVPANQMGTTFINSVQASMGTVVITNYSTGPLEVVEPTLQVSELVGTNGTTFLPGVATVQGNDTIYYQLIITNSAGPNGTTAYNLWLSNSLPTGLVNPQVTSVQSLNTGNIYATNDVTGVTNLGPGLFGLNGNLLTVADGNKIDLDTNAAFVLVVSAQLSGAINPSASLPDNTFIQWSSVPGAQTALSTYNAAAATARTGGSVSFAGVNYATNFSTNSTLLDNYAAAAATVVVTGISPTFAKTLVSTSVTNPGNGTTNVAVGELADYTVTLTVPQGVMTNVSIVDTLPTNMSYVDVTNVTVSAGVKSTQKVVVGLNSFSSTTTIGNANGGTGNLITFTLGTVSNTNTTDATATVAITFEAVVLDVPANQMGTTFINNVQANMGTVVITNYSTGPLQVVEPTLQVSEMLSTNGTAYLPGATSVQGNDTIYYQLVITNSAGPNGTTAYNLWLSNSLPAGLVNLQVTSVQTLNTGNIYATNNVYGVTNLGPGLFSLSGNLLTVAPGTEIALDTNAALVVVVSAQLSGGINPSVSLTNITDIQWSSVPGAQTVLSQFNPTPATARTGNSVSFAGVNYATNFSTNSTLLDNYAAVSPAVVMTSIGSSFSKALVSTSVTNPGNGATNVTIGELADYTLTLTVPQGQIPNMTIVDTLPPNMAFADVKSVTMSSGVSSQQAVTAGALPSNTAIGIANGGTNNLVTFSLGNVNNVSGNDAPATLVITLEAVVVDSLPNQMGTTFINNVEVSSGALVMTNYATGPLAVVEPTLQVGELMSTNGTSFLPGATGLQGSNTVYFQLVVTNSAGPNGTTAYNLWLSNSLPSGLVNGQVVSVTDTGTGNISTNGLTATNGLAMSTNLFAFNGNLLTVAGANEISLDTNAAFVLVISAQLAGSVTPAESLSNLTDIQWSSVPGTQSVYYTPATARTGNSVSFAGVNYATNFSTNSALLDNYAAVSPVTTMTMISPSFSKALVSTSVTNPGNGTTNVAIGELADYTLTLTVPQGQTPNVTIVDALPLNLAFVDVKSVVSSAGVSSAQPVTAGAVPSNTTIGNTNGGTGNLVTFTLGNVSNLNTNNGTATVAITFEAVVLDVLPNQMGTTFINNVQASMGSVVITNYSTGPLEVVEPTLQVGERISADNINYSSSAVAGTVYYQLTITNSAGPNGTTAYDLWLSNSLPAGLINPLVYSVTNLGTGNVRTNGLTGTNGLSTTLFGFTGNLLTVAGGEIDLDTNAAIVLVVAAQVGPGADPTVLLTNGTTIEWSSVPASPTNLPVYNAAATARTGLSAPLPAPGVNNSTNNTLLDNYAAASIVVLDQIPASIGNYVWNDYNADGVRQSAEKGIPGVQVFLDLNGTGQYAVNDPSAVTDTNGYYLITNLLGGTYTVVVNTNTLNTAAPGAHETYSLIGGTNAPQEAVSLVLTNGTTRLDANFGYDYTSVTLATLKGGSFQGEPDSDGILLSWTTLSEVDTAYYIVKRMTADGRYDDTIGYALALDAFTGGFYKVTDTTATAAGTYHYQLAEVQTDGSTIELADCTVVVGSATVAGTPVVITIKTVGSNIVLQWQGGTSPYYLEENTNLSQAANGGAGWVPVPLTDDTTNKVALPLADPAGFFRVRSGQ
jgi:uncharacterized protein (DUF486 family)